MKVIFLDHFGVMCLADKHGREHDKLDLPRFDEMRIHGNFDSFDTDAVNILNSIIDDVEIVVSSDWKIWTTLDKMGEFYLSQGIIKKPISFTKDLKLTGVTYQEKRSLEILDWLEENKGVTNWVAIDDMFLPSLNNFVWVSKTDEGIKQINIKNDLLKFLID